MIFQTYRCGMVGCVYYTGGISFHQVYATDNGDVFYVFFDCDTPEVPVMKYFAIELTQNVSK